MFAKRADKVLGQFIALIDIAADFADIALFPFGLGFGFDIVLIVGLGHRLFVGNHARLGHRTDEHSVRIEIDILLHFQRHNGVDIARQKGQAVVGAQRRAVGEFIHIAAAAKTERLKNRKRRVKQLMFIFPVCLITWWE